MITISLSMIVKNEEEVLERCLASISSCVDEIIIVDTGSTDRTKEIAAKYTDKIYDFTWIDDFSAARNYAFSKAGKDYILWLDADDIVPPGEQKKLKELKKQMSNTVDMVMMHYRMGGEGKAYSGFSFYRERLVKRTSFSGWREPVHEYMEIKGEVLYSDIYVAHAKEKQGLSTRNLDIYESRLKKGELLSSRGVYYYARELKDHGRFEEAAAQFSKFIDSGLGWMEDNIIACGELAKCYQAMGNSTQALNSMLRSFAYDTPRAEICCQIGYYFKEQQRYRQAVFWFEQALKAERPKNMLGFLQEDCWNFIPSLECVVCYDKLGDHKKAEYYNELAAHYKPGDKNVLHNKRYFKALHEKK